MHSPKKLPEFLKTIAEEILQKKNQRNFWSIIKRIAQRKKKFSIEVAKKVLKKSERIYKRIVERIIKEISEEIPIAIA